MAISRRHRFLAMQTVWLSASTLFLGAVASLTLKLFYVLSFLGFLVITAMTAPVTATPKWRTRLRWIIGVGFLGFAYITVVRILEVLPPEVV